MTIRSPSLFWRTFTLLVLLLIISALAWLQSFRVLSEVPFARAVSQQIVSTANLTRYALISCEPDFRPDLLKLLALEEGVRVILKEQTDSTEQLVATGKIVELVENETRHFLGAQTQLASAVNGEPGLWVSIDIEGDAYWLMIRHELLDPPFGTNWLWWALVAFLGSIIGATMLTNRTVTPLARLSQAAKRLGRGEDPGELPEEGHTAEIDALNRSFNRMVYELKQMAADREVLLAGVSHDLRTPLTRMRLEVELAGLPDDTREAMVSDLEQMEAIVNQFLVYAKPNDQPLERIDLGLCANDTLQDMRLEGKSDVRVQTSITGNLYVMADPMELTRAVQNLLVNADRYGRDPQTGKLEVSLQVLHQGKDAVLRVCDHGQGLPEAELERVTRPFERGDKARGGAKGSGLGLAIVKRVVERSGGSLKLMPNHPSGLICEMVLPLANRRSDKPKVEVQNEAIDTVIDPREKLF